MSTSPDSPPPPLAQGMTYALHFLLKRILGRGGLGHVWLAEDTKLEKERALKIVNFRDCVHFLRPAILRAKALDHPNIARVHDLLDVEGRGAIVMEYIDGTTLSELRMRQPRQVFEVDEKFKSWVDQMLSALEYAHDTKGIIHGNLKPSNFMVTSAGVLKVTDFGITYSLRESICQDGIMGPPLYMSPQEWRGEPPSKSDDIYVLGATLYELLTGSPLYFSIRDEWPLRDKIPPSIAKRRAELGVQGAPIPPAWEATIAACLEKQPQNRPSSIAAIRAGLAGKPMERGAWTRDGSFIPPDKDVPALATTTHHTAPQVLKANIIQDLRLYAAAAAMFMGCWYYSVWQGQRRVERQHLMKQESEDRIAVQEEERRAREHQERLARRFAALTTASEPEAGNQINRPGPANP